MRAFNPERELAKIQNGNKNKILYGIILLLLIISIGSTYALYQVRYSKRIIYTKVAPFSNKDINILAIYLDDETLDEFPEKGSKVVFDRVDCDNGSTGVFNTHTWQLILTANGKDKCSVYFKTTTDYIDDSGANPPELYQGLIPVTYDYAGKVYIADLTSDWYDYDDKRWANAVLVDNSNKEIKNKYFNEDGSLKTDTFGNEIPMSEILQMYVWIPRYKYQLFNVNNGSIAPQEIKIEFESETFSTGTVKCEISDKGAESCNNPSNGDWFTHPAFKFGNTDLPGIWVGKFLVSGNIDNDLTILPNKSPIVGPTFSVRFTASRNIEETNSNKYHLNRTEIDTHMMKNMEWGAMAYLTHSKYGRCNGTCTEVTANSNSSHLTGYASQQWNTTNGQLANTTGNMYGIYDTTGYLWIDVMGGLVNSDGSILANNYFNGFTNNKELFPNYFDPYVIGVNNDYKRGHLGDSSRETLKWYSSYADYPDTSFTYFVRGGSGHMFDIGRKPGNGEVEAFFVVLTGADIT